MQTETNLKEINIFKCQAQAPWPPYQQTDKKWWIVINYWGAVANTMHYSFCMSQMNSSICQRRSNCGRGFVILSSASILCLWVFDKLVLKWQSGMNCHLLVHGFVCSRPNRLTSPTYLPFLPICTYAKVLVRLPHIIWTLLWFQTWYYPAFAFGHLHGAQICIGNKLTKGPLWGWYYLGLVLGFWPGCYCWYD